MKTHNNKKNAKVYQSFGTAFRAQGCLIPTCSPKQSVNKYGHTLRNIPEERRPEVHRCGSLKFPKKTKLTSVMVIN